MTEALKKLEAFLDRTSDELVVETEDQMRGFIESFRVDQPESMEQATVILDERLARAKTREFDGGQP